MEANLFIKKYKTEGNKIKDLQFYGDMEVDIGGGGSGSSDKYHYATGKILFDKIDEFITPIKVDRKKYFMIQVPTDSYLYINYKNAYDATEIDHFINISNKAILLPGGSSYSLCVDNIIYSGINIILFSKNALIKGYGLMRTFIESLF